jgi:hypothetical protein
MNLTNFLLHLDMLMGHSRKRRRFISEIIGKSFRRGDG